MFPPKKKKDGPLNVSFEDWRRICIARTGSSLHSCPVWGGLLLRFNNFIVSEEKMEEEKVGSQLDT